VAARPVGVFWMLDEHGPDAKIPPSPPTTRDTRICRTSVTYRSI